MWFRLPGGSDYGTGAFVGPGGCPTCGQSLEFTHVLCSLIRESTAILVGPKGLGLKEIIVNSRHILQDAPLSLTSISRPANGSKVSTHIAKYSVMGSLLARTDPTDAEVVILGA
jgi:hypothetical protein